VIVKKRKDSTQTAIATKKEDKARSVTMTKKDV
jgi:hypothetical protein